MRRQSTKTRLRSEQAKPLRNSLIEQAGACQVCGSKKQLACHEILNGPLRQKTLDEPCSLLVVCWPCNQALTDKGKWPVARQLAILLHKSPSRYDLQRFCYLRNPNAPHYITQEEVDQWTQTIS